MLCGRLRTSVTRSVTRGCRARGLHSAGRVDIDMSKAVKHYKKEVSRRAKDMDSAALSEWTSAHNRCMRMNGVVASVIHNDSNDESAEAHGRAALAAANEADGLPPLHLLSAQRNLMVILAERDPGAALDFGHQALEGFRNLLGPMHPSTVSLLRELSVIALGSGDLILAEPLLEDAADACIELFGDEHPETVSSLMMLGQVRICSALPAEKFIVLTNSSHGTPPLISVSSVLTNVAAHYSALRHRSRLPRVICCVRSASSRRACRPTAPSTATKVRGQHRTNASRATAARRTTLPPKEAHNALVPSRA